MIMWYGLRCGNGREYIETKGYVENLPDDMTEEEKKKLGEEKMWWLYEETIYGERTTFESLQKRYFYNFQYQSDRV